MVVITIDPCDVSRAIEIVYSMKEHGYEISIDFDWKYVPSNAMSWENNHPTAQFTLYNDLLASWFRLKYE